MRVPKTKLCIVRLERPQDVQAIHGVHAASFPSDAEARLVDALRQAGRLVISLVAIVDGAVVGHVAFSPVTAATGAPGAGMGPVAVHESHRRQGIAAELIKMGFERCRAFDIGWVVVLGEPSYYGRFGFRQAAEFGLSDEFGGGTAFQAIELLSNSLPVGAGLVRYSPEFALVV